MTSTVPSLAGGRRARARIRGPSRSCRPVDQQQPVVVVQHLTSSPDTAGLMPGTRSGSPDCRRARARSARAAPPAPSASAALHRIGRLMSGPSPAPYEGQASAATPATKAAIEMIRGSGSLSSSLLPPVEAAVASPAASRLGGRRPRFGVDRVDGSRGLRDRRAGRRGSRCRAARSSGPSRWCTAGSPSTRASPP